MGQRRLDDRVYRKREAEHEALNLVIPEVPVNTKLLADQRTAPLRDEAFDLIDPLSSRNAEAAQAVVQIFALQAAVREVVLHRSVPFVAGDPRDDVDVHAGRRHSALCAAVEISTS